MVFRWSVWGAHTVKNIDLLKCSITTFQYHFGNHHDYLVCTDNIGVLKDVIGDLAKVIDFNIDGQSTYDIESKATWRKWCPRAKLDVSKTEIYIDSDVFLLKYPLELMEAIADPKIKFVIMDEFSGQSWQHGAMQKKATAKTPFINAGLFIQKENCDISNDLERELLWWKSNIPECEQTHHDEQGALAIALTQYLIEGQLQILPKDKYMLIGPNENEGLDNLDSVTLLHAIYPEHPAFYRFQDIILKNTE